MRLLSDALENFRPLLEDIFETLIMLAEHKISLSERDVIYIIKMAEDRKLDNI